MLVETVFARTDNAAGLISKVTRRTRNGFGGRREYLTFEIVKPEIAVAPEPSRFVVAIVFVAVYAYPETATTNASKATSAKRRLLLDRVSVVSIEPRERTDLDMSRRRVRADAALSWSVGRRPAVRDGPGETIVVVSPGVNRGSRRSSLSSLR
ncbi:MAG: hypothetical protein FJW96_11835 [Actinobacteria bacterium]|nr:hypothetical protein [Actinomycetota bacterium]